MKNAKLGTLGFSLGLVVLGARPAFAQQAEGSAQVGMGLPGATPQTATVAPAAGGTDHSLMVGHLGVGYLGRASVNVGTTGPGQAAVDAPIVGVRYWMTPGMGLDLGVGLGIDGGSGATPSHWAFAVHGGVPIALGGGRHYTFEIVPEANIGLGGGGVTVGGVDTTNKGFLFDLGARAGAEIQFGFIGLPELALQGSVGAMLNMSSASSATDGQPKNSSSNYRFGSTVFASPWAVFTNSVAALYYF
jgi:hypothetical protein